MKLHSIFEQQHLVNSKVAKEAQRVTLDPAYGVLACCFMIVYEYLPHAIPGPTVLVIANSCIQALKAWSERRHCKPDLTTRPSSDSLHLIVSKTRLSQKRSATNGCQIIELNNS
jgi:hypothetical protein